MRILDSNAKELKSLYLKLSGLQNKSLCFYPDIQTGISKIEGLMEMFKKRKTRVVNVAPVQSDIIVSYKLNFNHRSEDPYAKSKASFLDKTGIFQIHITNGRFLLIAKWFEGAGKTREIKSLLVGDDLDVIWLLRTLNDYEVIKATPKLGIWNLQEDGRGGIEYVKIDNLVNLPVIHPKIKEVENDINYYFSNVEVFQKYGMPGVRKTLLVSEPGTGKTSFFFKLAREHSISKCVVFSKDIQVVAKHMKLCAKRNVPTLVLLEDADATFSNYQGQSSLLNFLDGVDTPKNKKGAFICMSTNYPELIEERILKRPGRIDKIICFESLQGEYAYQCCELYFRDVISPENLLKQKDALINLFSGKTGAQIKEISNASKALAASRNEEISFALIDEVSTAMFDSFNDVSKYSKKSSIKGKTIGFQNNPNDVSTKSISYFTN